MSRNIAGEDSIVRAVRKVMDTERRVESQRELSELVLKELGTEEGREIRASPSRIRKAAILSGSVKIEISYRESERSEIPEICPVCGSAMAPVYNRTLDGKTVEIKRRCIVCPYSAGKKPMVPGKYIFTRTSIKEVPEEEWRIRKLKKAASRLRQAEKLIREALDGSPIPRRQDGICGTLEHLISSKETADTIPCILADLRGETGNDPLWTKPLSSPKYPDRKDF